jgi:hypothetical protein
MILAHLARPRASRLAARRRRASLRRAPRPRAARRSLAARSARRSAAAAALAARCLSQRLYYIASLFSFVVSRCDHRRTLHIAISLRALVCDSCKIKMTRHTHDDMYVYICRLSYSTGVRSFLVVYWTFVLATLSSIVVSFYNKTPPQRRSHSRVFTPLSPTRGGGGAQFCYPWGAGPDLAVGKGVVPRLSV